jgi:hypothetical protein
MKAAWVPLPAPGAPNKINRMVILVMSRFISEFGCCRAGKARVFLQNGWGE